MPPSAATARLTLISAIVLGTPSAPTQRTRTPSNGQEIATSLEAPASDASVKDLLSNLELCLRQFPTGSQGFDRSLIDADRPSCPQRETDPMLTAGQSAFLREK